VSPAGAELEFHSVAAGADECFTKIKCSRHATTTSNPVVGSAPACEIFPLQRKTLCLTYESERVFLSHCANDTIANWENGVLPQCGRLFASVRKLAKGGSLSFLPILPDRENEITLL
jgi:hypothetical protein